MKTYCKDCKWYVVNWGGGQSFGGSMPDCEHPKNLIYGTKDTWLHKDERYIKEWKHRPWEINTDNNCPWFEEIGAFTKIWRRLFQWG